MNQQDQTFYSILMRIEGKLGGIESELKGHKDTHIEIKTLLDKKDMNLQDHAQKIASLQDFRTNIKAKIGVISSIAGVIAGAIVSIIKSNFIE